MTRAQNVPTCLSFIRFQNAVEIIRFWKASGVISFCLKSLIFEIVKIFYDFRVSSSFYCALEGNNLNHSGDDKYISIRNLELESIVGLLGVSTASSLKKRFRMPKKQEAATFYPRTVNVNHNEFQIIRLHPRFIHLLHAYTKSFPTKEMHKFPLLICSVSAILREL